MPVELVAVGIIGRLHDNLASLRFQRFSSGSGQSVGAKLRNSITLPLLLKSTTRKCLHFQSYWAAMGPGVTNWESARQTFDNRFSLPVR